MPIILIFILAIHRTPEAMKMNTITKLCVMVMLCATFYFVLAQCGELTPMMEEIINDMEGNLDNWKRMDPDSPCQQAKGGCPPDARKQ